ncbi:MAG: cell division protein FtsA [Myxococcales bacterium]|nr:cell division protein FtsA [Myxococcales bacterium]MDD9970057.1 cell division protein FtsA [Myxococcales bacterium]
MADNELVAGLDLGTTKVCAIVGERVDDGIDIIGIGTAPSKGLKKGVVVNIESTVQAIRTAVAQAETMAGCEIGTVYAGITGNHVRGFNQEGVAAIAEREVTEEDVERVLEQSRAIPLPSDRQVLHVLPQEYIVDEQDGIIEPVGMNGVRLEARVHLVTAASASVQNVIKCTSRCDLDVAEIVLGPLASADAILSPDEKEIGVAVIDIGGGTTDVIVYVDGAAVHTSVIPVGGLNLTNDVATGLRTPMAEAERIKIKYGCSSSHMIEQDETIEVPSVGGRAARVLPRDILAQILEPRVEEVFSAVQQVLAETGYLEMLASGAVLCGGATLLDGMPELAEQVLGLPVRRGMPQGVGGLADVVRSPTYATAVGLVKYGAEQMGRAVPEEVIVPVGATRGGLGARIGGWFRDVF